MIVFLGKKIITRNKCGGKVGKVKGKEKSHSCREGLQLPSSITLFPHRWCDNERVEIKLFWNGFYLRQFSAVKEYSTIVSYLE